MILEMPVFWPVLMFWIQMQTDNERILNNLYFGHLTVYVLSSCIFQTILALGVTGIGHKNSETELNITLTPTALEF